MLSVYVTIWLSLACLAAAEWGRRQALFARRAPTWAVPVSAIGVALGALHSYLALLVAYDANFERAARETAERAASVFGVFWSGSIYVNYLFLAWWAGETLWWWRAPDSFVMRPRAVEWAWRAMVLVMVVNGGIVFASAPGRVAGIALTAALLAIWWPGRFTR